MGREASDDLFRLIKSLDPTEKRLVERHTLRHKHSDNNLYHSIFRAISEQNTFDNQKVRLALGRHITDAHLSAAKSYLFHSIVGVLSHSGWKISSEGKLRGMLDQAEWLHGKGLPELAIKLVQKGIKLSQSMEAFAYEAEFLRWKRRLIKSKGGGRSLETLVQIGEQEQMALKAHYYDARLRDILSQLQMLFVVYSNAPSNRPDKAVKRLVNAPELAVPPPPNHFAALKNYYFCKAFAALLLGKYSEAQKAFLSLLKEWDKKREAIRKSPRQYLETVQIYSDISLQLKSLNQIEKWIEKFDQVEVADKAEQAWIFFNNHHLWLRYALATGKFQAALNRSSTLEKGMITYCQHLISSFALTLRYNLGSLHFLAGLETEALRHFNIIRNLPVQHQRGDITDGARLIEILIYINKGEFDTVEYLARSASRKKKTASGAMFKIVLKLANAIGGIETYRQQVDLFKKALGECKLVQEKSSLTGLFELKVWLLANIEKQTMETIMRKGHPDL